MFGTMLTVKLVQVHSGGWTKESDTLLMFVF